MRYLPLERAGRPPGVVVVSVETTLFGAVAPLRGSGEQRGEVSLGGVAPPSITSALFNTTHIT